MQKFVMQGFVMRGSKWICWLGLMGTLFLQTIGAPAAESESQRTARAKQAFQDADLDQDGGLTLAEYVGKRESTKLLQRDFQLFDFDRDGKLSVGEFLPIAFGVDRESRGALPDPILTLVEDFVDEMDRGFNNWNERPKEQIPITLFIQAFPPTLGRNLAFEADQNLNGEISRAEAREFVETQLGVRKQGVLMRTENGLVNNHQLFLYVDDNRNNLIEREEYLARSYGGGQAEAEFKQADADRDGKLTFVEWVSIPRLWNDPIQDFRDMDKNLDGLLDAEELLAGTPDWKQPLCKHLLPAFDFSGDNKLSLHEYRLTPHANMLLYWMQEMRDNDGDRCLSFAEFNYDRPLFNLLRFYYFRRYDLDHDEFLDLTEYDFKVARLPSMYSLSEDGQALKKLEYGGKLVKFGSPAVSPDGRWLAFDGSVGPNSQTKIWLVPITGGEPKEIGVGAMPSFSADGKQLACCRYQPVNSVWIMDVTGEHAKSLGPGWGAQWSPDGKQIYFSEFGNETSLKVYDVESEEVQVAVAPEEKDYTWIEWNACWSPDSQRICVKAAKTGRQDDPVMLLVQMRGTGKDKVKVRLQPAPGKGLGSDFSWHPAGHRLVFTSLCDERKRSQFYELDPDTDAPPRLVKGQPETESASDMCWTPDGKQLILFCSPD